MDGPHFLLKSQKCGRSTLLQQTTVMKMENVILDEITVEQVIEALDGIENGTKTIRQFVINVDKLSTINAVLTHYADITEREKHVTKLSQAVKDARREGITVLLDTMAPRADKDSPKGYQLGVKKMEFVFSKIPKDREKKEKDSTIENQIDIAGTAIQYADSKLADAMAKLDLLQACDDSKQEALNKQAKIISDLNKELSRKNEQINRLKKVVNGYKDRVKALSANTVMAQAFKKAK